MRSCQRQGCLPILIQLLLVGSMHREILGSILHRHRDDGLLVFLVLASSVQIAAHTLQVDALSLIDLVS